MGYLCQLGTYAPLTDTFTLSLDLNDGQVLEIDDLVGLDVMPPQMDLYAAENPRTPGARVIGSRYGTRQVTCSVVAGPTSTYAALASTIAQLAGLQEAVRAARIMAQAGLGNAQRITLLIQPPGSTTPLYADVLALVVDAPAAGETQAWVRLYQDGITLELECAPFLRGARQVLQNLTVNPGFEAPSMAGFVAFNDLFANADAYITTGGTLGTDVAPYADVVMADQPLRYYRLDDTGSFAYDAMGSGNYGTLHNSPTRGVTGLLTGDSDTAMTFASASSEYISASSSGVATANHVWSLEAWIKTPSVFSAQMIVVAFGLAGTNHEEAQIYLDSAGKAYAGTYGGDTAGYALSTSSVFHLVATWDGTTLVLYVNGVSRETATPGAMTIPATGIYTSIGATAASAPTLYFNGTIDEVAIYTTALSSTRVSAHYTAGSTTPASDASSISVPVGATTTFGPAAWGPVNTWSLRWRYLTSQTGIFRLHQIDGNNYLAAQVTGTAVSILHVVGGTIHTLATSTSTVLVNGVEYWLQVTLFPGFGGQPPLVQASVYADNGGVLGPVQATAGPVPTYDAVTAMTGVMAIHASGAAIALNLSNTVTLFGPGGWWLVNASGGGLASAVWANTGTYPSGPVASTQAVQLVAAPAGTLDAYVASANVTIPALVQANGYPVTTGQTYTLSAVVASSGVASTCAQKLIAYEYDVNGNFLRGTTVASVTGAQSLWVTLSGSVTIGASTVYLVVALRATDATTGSVNGIITFDNAQVWNQANGASMPYCELAFAGGPAQLVVSGIAGDVPAPTSLALGTNVSLAGGAALSWYVGRRALAGWNAQLVGAMNATGADGVKQVLVLDSSAYGGYRTEWIGSTANYTGFFSAMKASDGAGAYHLVARARRR